MKYQRGIFSVSSIVATIASCTSYATAFQTSAFLSSSSPLLSNNHRSRSHLNTASKESTEIVNDEDDNLYEDDEDNDSWVLRQITFLGLSAVKKDDAIAQEAGDEETTPKNALDARNLSEFLMEIGACSVSITDSDADTDNEDPLFDEPSLSTCVNDDDDSDEELSGQWAMVIPDLAAGRNLWKRCDVSAHFPASLDVSSIIDSVRYTFHCPSSPRFKVDDVPDLDWIHHVQESWNPIVTRESKFVLRFPWHEDDKVMKACQEMEMLKMQENMKKQFSSGVKREGAVVHFEGEDEEDTSEAAVDNREYVQIQLEGGIAFGTGEHPTTRLCLDWVREKVEHQLHSTDDSDSLHFVDYGAGSGVLGIAAASIVRDYNGKSKGEGKSITTVGVEIDADAIHIADDNAKKNGVDMSNYLPDPESLGDAEALSIVMRAMQRKRNQDVKTLPEELNGPIYDLCAANILAAPLVNLAPTLASLVKSPGGEIGLSGVLAYQGESVVEAYKEFFDDVKVAHEDGGWVLITGKRR